MCLRDEGGQKIEAANQQLGAPDLKPEAADAARKSREEGEKMIRDALDYFEQQADLLAKKEPVPPLRARLLYPAAWGRRGLGAQAVDAERARRREELRL